MQTIYGWYDFTTSVVGSIQNHLHEQMNLLVGILCEDKQEINAPFFLPFNLSLTLDGISGIKIYQKFYMTEDILPPSYNNANIDLVIKSRSSPPIKLFHLIFNKSFFLMDIKP